MGKSVKTFLFLLILGLLAAAQTVYADEVYEIKELGLKVSLPGDHGLAVITRDEATHSDQELADDFNLTVDLKELREGMKTDQAYLLAFSSDWLFDLSIQYMKGLRLPNIRDYREVDEAELQRLADQAAELSKKRDPNFESYPEAVQRTPTAVFYRTLSAYAPEDGEKFYNYLYMTVHNDRLITLTFRCDSRDELMKQKNLQTKILDSLVFD